MKIALLVFSFIFTFNSLPMAFASERTLTSYQSFYGFIEKHRKNCAGVQGEISTCATNWEHRDLYDIKKEVKRIPDSLSEKLKEIAFDQAQIWGDTILEGDYIASGETILDQVFAIYENEMLKAYYIKYHEQAWYIGDCNYDENDPSSLNQCTEGIISEGTYISPDLKTVITDDENFADFQ